MTSIRPVFLPAARDPRRTGANACVRMPFGVIAARAMQRAVAMVVAVVAYLHAHVPSPG